jgi:hypothetical protein
VNLRCPRCQVPHYEHEDASKGGGMGRIFAWSGGLCPVCRQYRSEKEAQAQPFLLERAVGGWDNQTLDEFR